MNIPPITAVLVEDDPFHAKTLAALLQEVSPPVRLLGACTNVQNALVAIRELKPELVFLDIDLEGGDNGFELLKQFNPPPFSVIFTTQHASMENTLLALRASALDFLPKPVLLNELNEALQRVENGNGPKQLTTLMEHLMPEKKGRPEIVISNLKEKTWIHPANIIYCQSDNSYTIFHLATPVKDRSRYISPLQIKHWEAILKEDNIFRVHNRYLANFQYIQQVQTKKTTGAMLVTRTGDEIPVSDSRKKQVLELLKEYKRR